MSVYHIDTETTSREADREVIELAWIKLKTRQDLFGADTDEIVLETEATFCQRFRPNRSITFGSIAVHHILPSELRDAPPSAEATLPVDAKFLIAHSADFDWEAIGKPNVKRICTCAMAKAIWPQADSHSQSALLYMLEGATPETRRMLKDAHSAAADVANNLVLLEHILAAKPEIRTWSALHAFSEEARVPTVMFMGRNKGAPIAQLESSEIEWYLSRDFIDSYQRQALEREMKSRRRVMAIDDGYDEDEECDPNDDLDADDDLPDSEIPF